MRTGEHLTSLWECPSTAMDHPKRLKVKIRWPRIVFTTEKSTMISNKFMHSDVRHQTTIHNGTRLSVLRPSMYCYQSNGHVPNCNRTCGACADNYSLPPQFHGKKKYKKLSFYRVGDLRITKYTKMFSIQFENHPNIIIFLAFLD